MLDDDDKEVRQCFAPQLQAQRHRTVQEMLIPAEWRHHGRERRVPWLSMSGRWLDQAGFTPGMLTAIEVRHGCITIRPAEVATRSPEAGRRAA